MKNLNLISNAVRWRVCEIAKSSCESRSHIWPSRLDERSGVLICKEHLPWRVGCWCAIDCTRLKGGSSHLAATGSHLNETWDHSI